ncbi:DUF305 domain-containing protein [Carbonactinospora thermoautotrophica]|uniref:Putative lipoprotein n=1 Tax=Carbonactinospora thermoautotrophica TaxID=1469144 RepID=A0A132MZU1_9ACTN|nr:DUF305 domain-containing protein [Carbonactinospora thermoautotrophica]KWX02214.1 putative lipoprotein [Carbonactinospora thermoautotrophica]KWX03411.1 hypothetical protein TH66_10805 [Carbonactinospora thermoautotrophica]KWX05936.1 hypothetical protein TR74_23285 [Carbonactinospora thermoautotrophica]MCX9190119.1 DUF305 domain-containing protein [Carbonactinospora thermoautotrophica]
MGWGARRTVAVIALLLLLTGCGGRAAEEPAPAKPAGHNAQDVAFARGLIAHQQRTIEMARLADKHAANPEVRELAEELEISQRREMAVVTGWLESWGESPQPASDDAGGAPGVMSEDDVRTLGEARGTEFDWLFLSMMIEHDLGAVTLARQQVEHGQNADAVALARTIEKSRNEEIAKMQKLLGNS